MLPISIYAYKAYPAKKNGTLSQARGSRSTNLLHFTYFENKSVNLPAAWS